MSSLARLVRELEDMQLDPHEIAQAVELWLLAEEGEL